MEWIVEQINTSGGKPETVVPVATSTATTEPATA
jgi:hypothetical protein